MTRTQKTIWYTLLLGLIIAALCCVGCSTTYGTRTLPDGSKLCIRNYRFLWASEGIRTTTRDKNGFEFTLEVQRSNPDAQAMEAIAKGAAQGAMQGAKVP